MCAAKLGSASRLAAKDAPSRIATNLIYDQRRSRKLDELPEDLTATQSPDTAQDIAQAFARLKPKDRDILWMTRIACAVAAVTAALLAASIPILSRHVAEIGIMALSAVILPVALTLWGWSRSKL